MGKTVMRKFNGERYYCYQGAVHSKTQAEEMAERSRGSGKKARVVPYGSFYRLYVRG